MREEMGGKVWGIRSTIWGRWKYVLWLNKDKLGV